MEEEEEERVEEVEEEEERESNIATLILPEIFGRCADTSHFYAKYSLNQIVDYA